MLAIVKTDLNCVKSTQVQEKSSFAYFKTTEYIKILCFFIKQVHVSDFGYLAKR